MAKGDKPPTIEDLFPLAPKPPGSAGAGTMLRDALSKAAYEHGVSDTLALFVRKLGPWEVRRILERADLNRDSLDTAARVDALRRRGAALTPAQKTARTKQLRRQFKEEGQAIEFATLIRGGDTTESARAKMGIGLDKAKRLRAIAVKLHLLRPRQMKLGAP